MVGYTQYDLFGTHAFATLNIKHPISAGGNGAISPQLVVGIPLSPNQTFTATYDETRFSHDTTEFDRLEFPTQNAGRVLSARWSYNTTDDPFLPTNGTLLTAAPLVASRDAASFTFPGQSPADPIAASYHTNSYGIDFGGAHYFLLSDRNTIAVGGEAGWARVSERSNRFADRTSDATYQFAHVAFSHSLWDRERQKQGDSRFEWQVRLTNRDHGAVRSSGPEGARIEATWAWVRRSAYGTIRLGVGYAW
jgi:outer membrane protein assembly factor BamA